MSQTSKRHMSISLQSIPWCSVISVRISAKHNLRVSINTLVAVNSEGSCVFIIISSKLPQVKIKVNTNEPPDRTAKVTCQLSYLNWSLET